MMAIFMSVPLYLNKSSRVSPPHYTTHYSEEKGNGQKSKTALQNLTINNSAKKAHNKT